MTPPCEYLEWDSNFFQERIARITELPLTARRLESILAWRHRNRIRCLYLLLPSTDARSIKLAEENGFHLADTRITLTHEDRTLPTPPDSVGDLSVRVARAEDLPALKAIACRAHSDSRFYADRHFKRSRCSDLYKAWIEKSLAVKDGVVLVAEHAGACQGYVACQQGRDKGQVALIGVASSFRSKGIGSLLMQHALAWCRRQNLTTVTLVTQGRNLKALRFYQRCGFRITNLEYWYHGWYPVAPSGTPRGVR